MSINISIEEYEFIRVLKIRSKRKKKEFFKLNLNIIEREEKMNERIILYEKEKKNSLRDIKNY